MLSISYDKVLKIETAIANSAVKEKKENNNIYIPSNVITGKMLHFAIDNTEFNNDTPDVKHEFHGTGQAAIQKQGSSNISILKKV